MNTKTMCFSIIFSNLIMSEFAASFLCTAYTDPIEMYVLPALTQIYVNDNTQKFPFIALIQSLSYISQLDNWRLSNSTWLLHSVLFLEPPDFGM